VGSAQVPLKNFAKLHRHPLCPRNLGKSSFDSQALTGLQSAVEYLQATMAGAASQNRITAGVGIQDFMPGVDLDLFAGGMFEGDESYGSHSKSSVESYWIGLGLTWRIGACSSGCETESSQAVLPGTAQ
jgi:hypothetical protein